MEPVDNTNPEIVLPLDILYELFGYMTGKDIAKSRRVCQYWREAVDVYMSEARWESKIKNEYPDIYENVTIKTFPRLEWSQMYKTISLWPRIHSAHIVKEEFSVATAFYTNIESFQILPDGIIAVHKWGSIVYYKIATLKPITEKTIPGEFKQYRETEAYLVLLDHYNNLYVHKKINLLDLKQIVPAFINVKLFYLGDNKLYIFNHHNELFICNLEDDILTCEFVAQAQENVVTIALTNGVLNITTVLRNVFTLIDKEFVYRTLLPQNTNLMETLHKYDVLHAFNWKNCNNWKPHWCVPIVHDIFSMAIHGDMMFVGTTRGQLKICYAPRVNGIIQSKNIHILHKLKLHRSSRLPLARHLQPSSISQLGVTETRNGHNIFASTSDKMIVLKIEHKCNLE